MSPVAAPSRLASFSGRRTRVPDPTGPRPTMQLQRLSAVAGALVGASLLVSWAARPAPAASLAEVERTGTIAAWVLDEDARLYVQIQPAPDADEPAPRWFVTGEGQADRAQFRGSLEGLIQADVAAGGGLVLTVTGDGSRKLDGESRDAAVKITRLSRS